MSSIVSLIRLEVPRLRVEPTPREEHVLVCISPSPNNARVIEAGAVLARAFGAKLTALYVEPPAGRRDSVEIAHQLETNLNLAAKAGAEQAISYGADIPLQIAEFAKTARVTKIVLGHASGMRKGFGLRHDPSARLTKLLPGMELFLIPEDSGTVSRVRRVQVRWLSWRSLAIEFAILIAATLLGLFLRTVGFTEASIMTLYILAVLLTAFWTDGLVYGLLSSLLSVLTFNYFFTEPRFTLLAYDPGYPVTFVVMLVASVLTSSLTVKARQQAKINAEKAYRTEVLLTASRNLQRAESADEILLETARQLHALIGGTALLYPVENGALQKPVLFSSGGSVDALFTEQEQAAASWTLQNNKRSGAGTGAFSDARSQYLAVRGHGEVRAVAGIELIRPLDSFEQSLCLAILGECGLALDKQQSDTARQAIALKAQQEQLRANLLRAISHDLRTPLTSISGNADMLLRGAVPKEEQQQLYGSIYDDSIWLINLVENLLSITRMDDSSIRLNLKPELVSDVVESALNRIGRRTAEHNIRVETENDLLMANMDAPLIVQVLLNLIENAVKYTPTDSEIVIRAVDAGKRIRISVADDGAGIPDENKQHVFDLFYTSAGTAWDARRGLGLGLSLCRAIVSAHGGEITVSDNVPHGSVFTFTLQKAEVHLDE
jgi:two-component system sensor histidine kinase KdpD